MVFYENLFLSGTKKAAEYYLKAAFVPPYQAIIFK